ncbi:MAG: M56 family metallopeptidase, partial [Clostridia bacterium]|nr:M56 family metallopeptidase [Clostridia bacterium]
CHIKRFDHIVKLFSYLLLCVHWFNPMCWVAFNRMTYDMETSCDEMVFAAGITEEKKKQYSHTLVSVGTKKRFPAPAPINFDGISNTKSRIKHILKLKKTSVWIKIICFVLCAVVLIACAADVKQDTDNVDLIANALDNKIKVIDEKGKEAFIKDMHYDYITQALVDMDGDGEQDAVLELSDSAGYVVLREYKGDVYAYEMGFRGFQHLKTDGTYFGSSGAGDNGIYCMSFDGSIMKETVIAQYQYQFDTEEELYSINGESVTKEEFDEFYDKWQQKEEIVFAIKYKYSVVVTQPNGNKYTATVGFEADKAYLDIDGAENEYRLNLDLYDNDNIGNAVMQPYAVDVTFDGNIDILVPYMNTNAAMYYSAFVWDDGTERFKYVPNFEKIPNFVLDNEKARILAHRQGDMENYYAYCRFNGDEFITTNCVLFKCTDPDNYKYEITESQYDNGVLNDVAKYTVTGTEYYSVKGISAELDKYYELGSFWELDSGKWGTLNSAPAVAISTPSEKLLESGNYSTYIDEVLISDTLMFKANTDVIDFKFITVEYSEDLGTYSKGKILYSQPELTASGKPIVIYTQIDELISSRGIMFSYSYGGTEIYAIVYDMRNGGYYLKRISDNNELIGDKVDIAFEIGAATEEMIYSDDYIYFLDNTDQYGYKNAQLYIKPNSKLKEFKFIELDESEALRVGEVLYEAPLLYEKPFVFFTYINDVTYNRGFSYVDENGKEKYFAFCCDMSGESDLPFGVVDITDRVGVNETAEISVVKGVAFRFADAYLYNEIETARALMDSPTNECLEYFENDTNQYNSIECGEIVVTGKVSNDAGILSVVRLEIPFYETRKGYEGVTYMLMTLVKQDGDWRVTFFDFDA